MKRLAAVLSIAMLSASFVVPGHAAGPHRTQQFTYRAPSGFVIPGVSTATIQLNNNWATFDVLKGERSVTFSIEDASGRPALGHFSGTRFDGSFCRSTDQPLKVRPGDTIYVGAMLGPCDDGLSVVTTGTITATFSR